MKKLKKFFEFKINGKFLPTYEECLLLCNRQDSPFYETKTNLDGYNVSLFNYRLAQYSDFVNPIPSNPEIDGFEMRGICFVFNKDNSLYKRYILLEKFFNLNQTTNSMYSVVKNYKIKSIAIKEDGSIASFIRLPNGRVYGKSKMSFDSVQAKGITNLYKTNKDLKSFVDWTMDNDLTAIFEYVAPFNRIVLTYEKEELILLRLRDNKTGEHVDIREHLDKLGSIKIAPFNDDFKSLDDLVEKSQSESDKEGYVVNAVDDNGRDFFYKIKTPWYQSLHGVLTNDLYRENTIIKYILDDRIDDVLGQVPEADVMTHERINLIIQSIRDFLYAKVEKIDELYDVFMKSDSVKNFALKYKNHPEFPFVMNMDKVNRLKQLSEDEIIKIYGTLENFDKVLARLDKYELVKQYIETSTKRLELARTFLRKLNPNIKFQNFESEDEDS